MDKDRLYTKYRSTIDRVSVENDVDRDIAIEMTACVCEMRLGKTEGNVEYRGLLSDFPCEEFLKDCCEDKQC